MFVLALIACSPGVKTRDAPGENFQTDTSVAVTSPANGATVDPTFEVSFTAGHSVDSVQLFIDGVMVASDAPSGGSGALTVTVEEGRHNLALTGLDGAGDQLSNHTLTLRAAAEDIDWVTITSPSDGALVTNPVHFAIEAASNIEQVEIFADEWSLGTVEPGGILTYEFEGVGTPRAISAQAWSSEGLAATDDITITVEAGTEPAAPDWNSVVVDVLETYPTDGSYAYYWPESGDWGGNPTDIYYQGDLFAEGDAQNRSFCVGMTFEVFMRSFDDIVGGSLNGISFDELYTFRTDWYVRELYGSGVVEAVENYGIGSQVTDWDDIAPGDFVQFWRHSGSGHNVIFIDWVRTGSGNISGFEYWSTQGSTDGVGYNSEYFGSTGSSVDPNSFFVGRVAMPDDWVSW